jgi:hypothetical protein
LSLGVFQIVATGISQFVFLINNAFTHLYHECIWDPCICLILPSIMFVWCGFIVEIVWGLDLCLSLCTIVWVFVFDTIPFACFLVLVCSMHNMTTTNGNSCNGGYSVWFGFMLYSGSLVCVVNFNGNSCNCCV